MVAASRNAVAVVGMAARFPAAPDLAAFWRNLRAGEESLAPLDEADRRRARIDERLWRHPRYVRAAHRFEGADLFDAELFGMAPRDALLLDPQVRILLECAHQALEQAGYDPWTWSGRIGVFAGGGTDGYALQLLEPGRSSPTERMRILEGNEKDYLPLHLAYRLNLRGPCVNVQATCATGLVAVHLACESLRAYECDLALAGAASLELPGAAGYLHDADGITSPDGHCRAFDAAGRGVCFSSGAGLVVLRREEDALADGDHVHAVICGSAVTNDGRRKAAFMAPSEAGQYEAVAEALSVAGFPADTIGYVEAHGTGTVVGDPIEIGALTRAFRDTTARVGYCPIGSVKTNIGHTSAAAGIAGFVKTVLALEHGEIPPSLHFGEANPLIDFARTPFFVNTTLRPWAAASTPRRAGVSSFGLGGTNVHVVLEQAPGAVAPPPGADLQLLLVSGRTPGALATICDDLALVLGRSDAPALADVAYTLAVGRRAWEHRRAVLCRSTDEARSALGALARELREGKAADGVAGAPGETDSALRALASEWLSGGAPDRSTPFAGQLRRRVPLPGHPLVRRRFWPEAEPGEAWGDAGGAGTGRGVGDTAAGRDAGSATVGRHADGPVARSATEALAPAPGAAAGSGVFFEPGWRPLPDAGPGTPGAVLALADEGGVAEALRRRASAAGQSCAITRSVRELAALLRGRDAGRLDVVDLRALDLRTTPAATAEAVLDDARRLLAGVVELGQAMAAAADPGRVHLWLVTRHAQSVVPGDPMDPTAASLWGLGRSLRRELPGHVGLVDLGATSAEVAAGLLLAELAPAQPKAEVALRQGKRHGPELRPARLAPATPTLRADRTYVVTGGLGALGLFCAERLAELGARSLLLVGRRPPGAAAARVLARLAAAGVSVATQEADVADAAALRAALASGARPPVAGIVHVAGVSDDVTLARGTTDRLLAPLPAKVKGGWELVRWAREHPLDFLVLFSSTASLQGGVGQTGYAAAHAFLDGLAHLARDLGCPATAVAWGPWEEVGIGAARARQGQGSVSLALARHALEAVLASRPVQLMVSGGPEAPGAERVAAFGELLRGAAPDHRRELLRGRLRYELARLLGLAAGELDEQADLTDLGLDSFLAIELRNRIELETGLSLPVRLLFEYPTVASLATFLAAACEAPAPARAEPTEAFSYALVATEPELGRALEALRASPREEGAALHYLHDDDPETFAAPAALAARVARGDLVMIAVHDPRGRLAGVRCATREASLPYLAADGTARLRDAHELHWLLLPEHRGRFDTDAFGRWLAAHDPLRARPTRRVSLLTPRPEVVRGYLRALAHVVGGGPAGEERAFATLSRGVRDPRAVALVEAAADDPRVHHELRGLLRERLGVDLLALPGASADEVLRTLQPLLRPSVVHLLVTRVELMRRGEGTLLGYGMRYLEPLFEYPETAVL